MSAQSRAGVEAAMVRDILLMQHREQLSQKLTAVCISNNYEKEEETSL